QLIGTSGNAARLSAFSFGTGGPSGNPTLVGGATGNLSSTVTLTNTTFLNEFTQTFTPGAVLSFDLELTTQVQQQAFPDEFTIAILDRTGAELPTKSFADVFVNVDITAQLTLQSYGSDPNRSPRAGRPPLNIAPPTVTTSTPVAVPNVVGLQQTAAS